MALYRPHGKPWRGSDSGQLRRVRAIRRADEVSRVALHLDEVDAHAFRRAGVDGRGDLTMDVGRILARNETAGDLREDLRRNDRLGALALVTATDAVELEGRREAHGFEAVEARGRDASSSTPKARRYAVFAERQLAELFALPAGRLFDAFVEAFDRDGVIGVVERGAEFGQRLDRDYRPRRRGGRSAGRTSGRSGRPRGRRYRAGPS